MEHNSNLNICSQPGNNILPTTSKSFIENSLEGLVYMNREVALLENHRIIIRRDHNVALCEKVKLLAGCGAGHEPAFISYVGQGMLTAAIQGNLYQCPNIPTIITALRELGTEHRPGVLIIIKNTRAERLRFSIAIKKTKMLKINVKMIVVDDDCFGIRDKTMGCVGLAGVIFIIKVAGAMAEAGKSLNSIFEYCQHIVRNGLSTCSARLSVKYPIDESCCTSASRPTKWYCELGVYLDGSCSKDTKKQQIQSVYDLVHLMLDALLKNESEGSESSSGECLITPLAIMINNLGSSMPVENNIVVGKVVDKLRKWGYTIDRIYCGKFITSLNCRGYSISLLKMHDENLKHYLDLKTTAPGWEHTVFFNLATSNESLAISIPSVLEKVEDVDEKKSFGPKLHCTRTNIIQTIMNFVCDALISCEKQLNFMDAQRGDGDTGSNVAHFMQTVKVLVQTSKIDVTQPGKMFWNLSKIAEVHFPGTLGPLYVIIFEIVAQNFMNITSPNIVDHTIYYQILESIIASIKEYGEVDIGDGTMLDCFNKILNNIRLLDKNQILQNPLLIPKVAAESAEKAAEETATKRDASYDPVPKKLNLMKEKEYPDPGAQIVAVWMRAVYEGLKFHITE